MGGVLPIPPLISITAFVLHDGGYFSSYLYFLFRFMITAFSCILFQNSNNSFKITTLKLVTFRNKPFDIVTFARTISFVDTNYHYQK